ncbi:MAG: hypothetical protein AB3N18_11145 [Allomuricauda sp.]
MNDFFVIAIYVIGVAVAIVGALMWIVYRNRNKSNDGNWFD